MQKPSIPKGTRDFSPVEMAKTELYIQHHTRCISSVWFPADRNTGHGELIYING